MTACLSLSLVRAGATTFSTELKYRNSECEMSDLPCALRSKKVWLRGKEGLGYKTWGSRAGNAGFRWFPLRRPFQKFGLRHCQIFGARCYDFDDWFKSTSVTTTISRSVDNEIDCLVHQKFPIICSSIQITKDSKFCSFPLAFFITNTLMYKLPIIPLYRVSGVFRLYRFLVIRLPNRVFH